MCFTGLVPAEYSDGERTRRGSITKAGSEPARTALIEAGLVLPVPARDRRHVSPPQARRGPADRGPLLAGAAPAARPYKAMTARSKPAGVAVTAMACKLAEASQAASYECAPARPWM
jgi:transposase